LGILQPQFPLKQNVYAKIPLYSTKRKILVDIRETAFQDLAELALATFARNFIIKASIIIFAIRHHIEITGLMLLH